jgi:type IV pilus assembly protein PilM
MHLAPDGRVAWWTRSRRALRFHALDIGSYSVKLLTVCCRAGRVLIEAMAVEELPPGVMQGHLVRERDVAGATIRRLVRQVGGRHLPAVTALPGTGVMVRRIDARTLPGEPLEAAVVRAATAIVPDAAERAVLDFQALGPTRPDGSQEVMLVAARRELVQSFTSTVRAAGLEPRRLDVETFALDRMYRRSEEAGSDPVALLHLGARYSSISVLRGAATSFVGDVPGVASGGDVVSVADEVRRALGLFWHGPAVPLGGAVLSGGGCSRPGIAAALASRLDCPVSMAAPFRRLEIGPRVDRVQLERLAPALAVTAGLALRSLAPEATRFTP